MTIPNRTFVMRADPYGGGFVGRSFVSSKQNQMRHDANRKQNIIWQGDYANQATGNSAAGMVWAYDPVADVVDGDSNQGFTQISGVCHGPGNVTPAFPNDGSPCGMDYQEDVFWGTPGSFTGTTGGTCSISSTALVSSTPGSTYYKGLLKLNPATGLWTGVSENANAIAESMKGGQFDPVQRCLIGVEGSHSVTRIFVDSLTKSSIAINHTTLGVPFPGTGSAGGDEIEPAFDWVGRWGYYFAAGRPNPADAQPWRYYLIRFNLDDPSVQQKMADPPFIPSTYVNGYQPNFVRGVQWDSRNRRLLWFYRRTAGGVKIHGIGAYNPVTNAWETIPITQTPSVGLGAICGATICYDSTNNVFIGYGNVFGYTPGEDPMNQETDVTVTHYWLWRYA